MITEDAIAMLVETIPDAVKVEVVTSSKDPYRFWLSNRKTGVLEMQSVPVVMQRQALSIESYVDQLANLFGEPEGMPAGVYVDRERINAVVDPTLRELLTMDLSASRAMQWLTKQSPTPETMDHRKLLRVLKTVLPDNGRLIDAVQSIKVTTNTEGSSEIKRGKESVGNDIERNLVDWAGPEETTFDVQVLDQPDGLRPVPIRCLFDTDLSGETPAFAIIPRTGEIERAWRETIGQIIDLIKVAAGERKFDHYGVYMGSIAIT